MSGYNEARFLKNVDAALTRIRTILDNTRAPRIAKDVSHSYEDKYGLAEFITNTSAASLLNALETIGSDTKKIQQLKNWSDSKRSVSLRLQSTEKCTFNRKEEKKVESASQNVTEIKSIIGKATITDKVVTKVREYFWDFEVSYQLIAFPGNTPDDKVVFIGRVGTYEIKTSSEATPKPQTRVVDNFDLNISWLLQNLNSDLQTSFHIDRNDKSCHTPRRNNPVDEAFGFFGAWNNWANSVRNYFNQQLFTIQTKHGLDLSVSKGSGLFVPAVPLLEKTSEDENASLVLPVGDINEFLEEQKKSLAQRNIDVAKVLPADTGLITKVEGGILVALEHSFDICHHFFDGLNFIEDMLRSQLISAIGKEVESKDFSEYMVFHNRKLFQDLYQPQQFCYAVRRPDHYPEGVVSVLNEGNAIYTTSRRLEGGAGMRFAIDAATDICVHGEQYIHTWVNHCFSNEQTAPLKLQARARQFSSFIIVIGTVISADEFHPEHAIMIQNKDEVLIPLLLEQIPTPKAFRDAIDSLSPEQQDFAKAFRQMQLDSTLFGICVIQIKPQLERLLNLPEDSLTKEIQLTQNLMELFVEYQIPSDLLSYEGENENASRTFKVDYVKKQVSVMQDMIKSAKEKEVAASKQQALFSNAAAGAPPPPTFVYGGGGPPPVPMSYSCAPMSACAPPPPSPGGYGGPPPPPSPGGYGGPPPPPSPGGYGGPPPPPPANISTIVPSTTVEPVATPKAKEPKADKPIVVDAEPKQDIAATGARDITKIPNILNNNIDKLDVDAALHSTIIKPSTPWHRDFQKSLLSFPSDESLSEKKLKQEKNKAFDLLDGLTRSGALDIYDSTFHVLIATTHCFDKTLINTVVQENVNPIDKVERSMLIVTSTIHEEAPAALIKQEHLARVSAASPNLFE